MFKECINLENSSKIIGAYSHAVKVDVGNCDMIFVTGQIAQDSSGNVICDDIEGQTEYIFNLIQDILSNANSSLDDVVKVQIFLKDINDFSKVSPIRNKYLLNAEPVSTLLEVSNLVKKECKIEIEVTAIKKKSMESE